MAGVERKQPPRRWLLLATGVAALAIAGVIVAVLLLRHDDSEPTGAFPTTPVASSVSGLRSFAAAVAHPVFWAGPLQGDRYELRLTAQGRVFIRYLPDGVDVGDRRAFLTVATYRVANAVRALRRAAAQGGVGIAIQSGGYAYYRRSRPTSVYFASARAPDYEAEVFAPSAARARALVVTGQIRPVG